MGIGKKQHKFSQLHIGSPMLSKGLAQFLSKSDSLKSLLAEREVVRKLQKLKWNVSHGAYYTDPKESKLREVDVIGKQYWVRGLVSGPQSLKINLVVECKSLKNTNIIISPKESDEERHISRLSYWFGRETSEEDGELQKVLVKYGIEQNLIPKLNRLFEKKAFPREIAKTATLHLDPIFAEYQSTAFREISASAEKELDASVLWRATQTVSSAVRSDIIKTKKWHMEMISMTAQFADKTSKDSYIREIVDDFEKLSSSVSIWHPIIVLDAQLWSLSKTKLTPINWFRFGEVETDDAYSLWCDIVNREHFDSFIRSLDTYYSSKCRKARAKLIKG